MRNLVLGLAIVLTVGCASTYEVVLSGVSPSEQPGRRVVYIVPLSNDAAPKVTEYKRMMARAFEAAGHEVTDDVAKANEVVLFTYSLKAHSELGSSPVYSWVGPQSKYDTGSLQQTGSETYSYTQWTRTIGMSGHDAKKPPYNPANATWSFDIVSSGPSSDLRAAFPVMLAGAADYIGKDTDGQIRVSVSASNELASVIRNKAK